MALAGDMAVKGIFFSFPFLPFLAVSRHSCFIWRQRHWYYQCVEMKTWILFNLSYSKELVIVISSLPSLHLSVSNTVSQPASIIDVCIPGLVLVSYTTLWSILYQMTMIFIHFLLIDVIRFDRYVFLYMQEACWNYWSLRKNTSANVYVTHNFHILLSCCPFIVKDMHCFCCFI